MARVLISMKDGFLEQIDKIAEEEQRSRSELFREALRRYVQSYVPNNSIRSTPPDTSDGAEAAG